MRTILLGNGLNRISYDASWSGLVHTIDEDFKKIDGVDYLLEDKIPNTIQFNSRLIKAWKKSGTNTFNLLDSNKNLKLIIKEELKKYSPISLHQQLLSTHPQHIITTNYDYVINKAIEAVGFYSSYNIDDSYQEQKYSIRRCKKYFHNNKRDNITVWNIHGELNYINSIMLGYDHYCNTIGLIDDYLNGSYKYNKRLRKSQSMTDKILNNGEEVLSWIDLFFFSDIHILGFGFGYEELDLWYVLMKRKELQTQLGKDKINNKIYFYNRGTKNGKRELLELYDIQVIETEATPIGKDYSPVYEDLIKKMGKNIKS